MTLAPAGYSGRPLPAKLGFKDGMAAAFVALPESLAELTECVGFASVDEYGDWAEMRGQAGGYDAIHAFSVRRAEIDADMPTLEKAIRRDGMIWVSWPKKASKVVTDVTEGVVLSAALAGDLVDIKVAAVDETWSGLKLVIRKERR